MSESFKQFYPAVYIRGGKKGNMRLQVVLRTEGNTSWHCGYITLSKEAYNRLDLSSLDCPGGITYTREETRPPYDCTIGFDCAHSGDSLYRGDPNWRDYFFVMGWLTRLTNQISEQLS